MRHIFKIYGCIFVIFELFLLQSCKKEVIPTLSTSTIYNITATTASSGGNITSDGGADITARGVCWSLNENPTISDSKTNDGNGIGQFVSNLNNLTGGSTYHVRAYATNSVGTAYGADLEFTTLGQAPEAITQAATNILPTGATLNGTVNPNNLPTTVFFEYGITASYGQTVDYGYGGPILGNILTNVSAEIENLTPGTTYHFRVKTFNSLGTTYGDDMTFTTLGQKPTAITLAACCIRNNGATLNGSVNANYLSTTVSFEYGTTANYGSSVTAFQSPVSGNNSKSVSASITGLNSGTTYHFRVKAVNSIGVVYGDDFLFSTLSTVTDVDGNTYNFVVIGSQTWMKENLKVTKYRNGELIGTTTPETLDVSGEAAPKYQWAYDGNESNVAIYGRLYTWYAITDSRNLCPAGWHVPSDAEWTVLSDFLGGSVVAGSKLKETGTTHWLEPNTDATNETGFTALPGGLRTPIGNFGNLQNDGTWVRNDGNWWSSTAYDAGTTWDRVMSPIYPNVGRWNYTKAGGLSVRCVRD